MHTASLYSIGSGSMESSVLGEMSQIDDPDEAGCGEAGLAASSDVGLVAGYEGAGLDAC